MPRHQVQQGEREATAKAAAAGALLAYREGPVRSAEAVAEARQARRSEQTTLVGPRQPAMLFLMRPTVVAVVVVEVAQTAPPLERHTATAAVVRVLVVAVAAVLTAQAPATQSPVAVVLAALSASPIQRPYQTTQVALKL